MKKTMKKIGSTNRKTRKTMGGHLMLFEKDYYKQIKIIDLGVIGDFDIKISSHAFKHLDTFDDFKNQYHPHLATEDDVYENSSLLEYYYNYKLNGYDKSEKNRKPTLNPYFTGPFSEFVKKMLTSRIKDPMDLRPEMFDTNYKVEKYASVESYDTKPTVNSITSATSGKTVNLFVIYIPRLAILYESGSIDGKLKVNQKGEYILVIRSLWSISSRGDVAKGPSRFGIDQPAHYSQGDIFPLEKRPTPKDKNSKKESTKKKLLSFFKNKIASRNKRIAKEKKEKEEKEKKEKKEEETKRKAEEDKKDSKEWVLRQAEAKQLAAEKTKDSKRSRPTDKERKAKTLSDLDSVINPSKGKK